MVSRPVALVTGGGRGIGRAISLELAKSGFDIVVTFRANLQAAEETVELIRQAGGRGEAVCFDVAEREETEKQMEALFTRHEGIDVLVNNAGETADSLFVLMFFEEWRRVLDTSLQPEAGNARPRAAQQAHVRPAIPRPSPAVPRGWPCGCLARKSISNRALLLAGLAGGTTLLHDPLDSDDTRVMIDALRAIGCVVQARTGALAVTWIDGRLCTAAAQLHLGNAGNAMRPLTPTLAVLDAAGWALRALRRRAHA